MSIGLSFSERYTLWICATHPTVHLGSANRMDSHRVDTRKLERLEQLGLVTVGVHMVNPTAHVTLTDLGRDTLILGGNE